MDAFKIIYYAFNASRLSCRRYLSNMSCRSVLCAFDLSLSTQDTRILHRTFEYCIGHTKKRPIQYFKTRVKYFVRFVLLQNCIGRFNTA